MSISRKWMLTEQRRVLENWVDELAQKLNRSPEQLLMRGLGAQDFPSVSSVHLKFEDGSSADFQCAFCVKSIERGLVAVFTEHCGYLVFAQASLEITT